MREAGEIVGKKRFQRKFMVTNEVAWKRKKWRQVGEGCERTVAKNCMP